MSKALFICYRQKEISNNFIKRLNFIQKKILPDDIIPKKLDCVSSNSVISCIMNPVSLKQRNNKSVCLGFTNNDFWWQVDSKNDISDGSYAIFRENQNIIEFQTDAVGSRTIWYYYDDEILIGSNSQLAIIYYLGSFQFNNDVVPWMLSSGTLGPNLSWDKRIHSLKPQTKLLLNKETWKLDIKTKNIDFTQNDKADLNDDEYLDHLSSSIKKSIHSLPWDKNLLLPLSGGYDSRGILLSLENENGYKDISTITWGSKKAVHNKKSDAYVAKKLAEHFKTDHKYVLTESSGLSAEVIIERFLTNSEGRIDHISGYLDGFKIWKDIFENKYAAIVRGDEGFGWGKIYSEKQARTSCGLYLMEDFNKLKDLGYEHVLPKDFERKLNESPEEWRDRLYHTFRLPTILAALNETKTSYIEVLNPLLSYSILKLVRNLPDRLRTDKKLFKLFVEKETPNIPFAIEVAISDYRDQLKSTEFINYFSNVILNSNQTIIDKSYVEELIKKVNTKKRESVKEDFIKKLKKITPNYLKKFLKAKVRELNPLDDSLLVFRIFILIRMEQKINDVLDKL